MKNVPPPLWIGPCLKNFIGSKQEEFLPSLAGVPGYPGYTYDFARRRLGPGRFQLKVFNTTSRVPGYPGTRVPGQ
eukprot:2230176-Rhodomonas_salina.8